MQRPGLSGRLQKKKLCIFHFVMSSFRTISLSHPKQPLAHEFKNTLHYTVMDIYLLHQMLTERRKRRIVTNEDDADSDDDENLINTSLKNSFTEMCLCCDYHHR